MSFVLAHFSDVHLGPVSLGDVFGDFKLKRLIGGCSWAFRRNGLHRNDIAELLQQDMLATNPDHICFTGDLVNISAKAEFCRGAAWLSYCGMPKNVSMVPGNHDAYVTTPYESNLGLLRENMRGDGGAADITFPFVRLRRNIAIIGLSSAQPQPLTKAGGTLGEAQRNALAARLVDLGARGFYRVVMIHHPPLPNLAKPRKALADAAALKKVLEDHGAELVLHGHNHKTMINRLKTTNGVAHIIGLPSASMADVPGHESAQWHSYAISRSKGQWQTRITIRRFDAASNKFAESRSETLGDGS